MLYLLINHEEVIIRFHTKICSLPFFWQHGLSQAIWDRRTISLLWEKLYWKQGNWCQLALDHCIGVAGGENRENWGSLPLICSRSVLTGRIGGPTLIACIFQEKPETWPWKPSSGRCLKKYSLRLAKHSRDLGPAFWPSGFYEPAVEDSWTVVTREAHLVDSLIRGNHSHRWKWERRKEPNRYF